jgi:hypothetical protein
VTISQSGSDPTQSFTGVCGKATATDDGVAQPALQVRLFNCGV